MSTEDLLRLIGGYCEEEYLRFLAARMPDTLTEELAGSDLHMADTLTMDDVTAPLRTFHFPREKIDEYWDLFDCVQMSCVFPGERDTPNTILYAASLQLWINTLARNPYGLIPETAGALVREAAKQDMTVRLHTLKFLAAMERATRERGEPWKTQCPAFAFGVATLWSLVVEDLHPITQGVLKSTKPGGHGEQTGLISHLEYDPVWTRIITDVFGENGRLVSAAGAFSKLYRVTDS